MIIGETIIEIGIAMPMMLVYFTSCALSKAIVEMTTRLITGNREKGIPNTVLSVMMDSGESNKAKPSDIRHRKHRSATIRTFSLNELIIDGVMNFIRIVIAPIRAVQYPTMLRL